jgi:putative sterol carrier protein
MDEVRKIREEYQGKTQPIPHKVRMNQVITDVPFGDGTINLHIDTSSGELVMEENHLDEPDLTVTTDYETAKAIIVDGNPQAGMQAFMAGKVKVQGDMSKLMMMQQATPDPSAAEISKRIQDITA